MLVARIFIVAVVCRAGFRYFALDSARREGVHGYVTNQDDGKVEASPKARPKRSNDSSAHSAGPSRSRVEHVMVDENHAGDDERRL